MNWIIALAVAPVALWAVLWGIDAGIRRYQDRDGTTRRDRELAEYKERN